MVDENGPFPVQRVSAHAVSSFLQQPQSYLSSVIPLFQQYWQLVSMFNNIVDSVGTPLSAGDYKPMRVKAALGVGDSIVATGGQLLKHVAVQLSKLGPLVSP